VRGHAVRGVPQLFDEPAESGQGGFGARAEFVLIQRAPDGLPEAALFAQRDGFQLFGGGLADAARRNVENAEQADVVARIQQQVKVGE
jgi:hypothetical protein